MKVRWCGNGNLNFTHVEEEGKVAIAILLPYLVPPEKGKRGAPHHSHSWEDGDGVPMARLLPYLVASEMEKRISHPHSHPCGKEKGVPMGRRKGRWP